MRQKVAIITGADGGMGRIITERIARENYKVIMACRNMPKAQAIAENIRKKNGGDIVVYPLDLASFQSIDHFIASVKRDFSSFDLLLNNAGMLPHQPDVTEDGIEITAGTNYLGHYKLTTSLIPYINKGGRIVNMASLSYKWFNVKDHFFEPVDKKHFHRFVHYSASKRALVFFTLDFAEKLKEQGITINCADPGIVDTNIIQMGIKVIDKMCDWLFRPIIYSPEKGAETMIYLALSPEVADETGGYFAHKKKKKIPNSIRNSPQRAKLREMTEKVLVERIKIVFDE